MAFDHSKFLARFVSEAREHCARLSEGLLLLEKAPGDVEVMNSIFRSAHTIKGSARMMKQTGVSELAHCMEDVFDAARNQSITLTDDSSDILLRGVDTLLAMLDKVCLGEQPEFPSEMKAALISLLNISSVLTESSGQGVSLDDNDTQLAVESLHEVQEDIADDFIDTPLFGVSKHAEYLRVNAAKLDDLIRLMGEIISEHGRFKMTTHQLREIERAASHHAHSVANLLTKSDIQQGERKKILEAGATLGQSLRQARASIDNGVKMQSHLISELQETSLKLRMQPLSTVFDPLRRTVRDLAHESSKEIDFVVEGGDTELDRKITEQIGDSLLHMIRNSMDHGLENAEERVALGKPRKGTIRLTACYDSGGVSIALSDDGRGLCTDKIREKALGKRLFDAETLGRMSRGEIHNIIFLPGFSTSPIITDLSGRGVGMDVVRKNIVDELKGTVLIETEGGKGTTFFLRLPLNLAVFPLFLVRTADVVSALPATYIEEMISADREEIIEIVNKRAIRLREQLVPVEDLAAILKQQADDSCEKSRTTIVVIRDGENKLGLLVDEILGREEMIVKPLPAHLKRLRLVTGGTLGEGGAIINVLHVPELMNSARNIVESGRKVTPLAQEQGSRILVVDDSMNTREIEKSILEAYGYIVETAEDGQDALEMLDVDHFDLIVTDVEMPRLDGFSLTEQLRLNSKYKNIPIIIVTSLEKEEDKKRGIAVGADAYIVKRAFDQSNLLDTVKNLIG